MAKHKVTRASFWARWAILAIALGLLATGGAVWIVSDQPKLAVTPNPVVGQTTPAETTLPQLSPTPSIESVQAQPFVPTTLSIEQIGKSPVQPLERLKLSGGKFTLPDPEPGPLESKAFAWDKEGARPGSTHGAVNFTAHTYPPGQVALGNKLQELLTVGDIITVRGQKDTLRYQVIKRAEVLLSNYPTDRVLDTAGPSVLTITVCSGERLGPGNWTMRTVWFAVPMK